MIAVARRANCMRFGAMVVSTSEIADTICRGLARAECYGEPYLHFYADDLLPQAVVDALATLPIEAPDPPGFSGKRDAANAARFFINAAGLRRFPVLAGVAEAFQSSEVVGEIAALSAAPLTGTYLRLEYAIDRDGFWLEPHTDLGEKKFTCLISLAEDERQRDLGTDIYSPHDRLHKRAPFRRNGALMFVPGAATWHGFAKRPIAGLRRSLILNYVGPQWRERGQLAFPDRPVPLAASFNIKDGAAPAPR
jgi:hypothetical protein